MGVSASQTRTRHCHGGAFIVAQNRWRRWALTKSVQVQVTRDTRSFFASCRRENWIFLRAFAQVPKQEENGAMPTKTAFAIPSPVQRWAGGSRARQELIAESLERAAQTNDEALAGARAMALSMRSGKPLQRAPAR